MSVRQRRYPKEEFARRGDEIYERDVKPLVEPEHNGKIVAIDIETGAWEMDADEMLAGNRLRQRVPDSQTWVVRVGYPFVHRFGGGRPASRSSRDGSCVPTTLYTSDEVIGYDADARL